MSKIALSGNASGTGTFTLAAPNSNSDRTLNLPDAGGTVVSDTATQTLTNKTIQGGALTLATAVTASGTSVDFTSIPSWVKRITVLFNGASTNGTSRVILRIGAGSFETSGYLSTALINGLDLTETSGFFGCWRGDAGNVISGAVVLTAMGSNVWTQTGSTTASTGASQSSAAFSGAKTIGGVLDRVRITTVNGTDTFDAGTINIMYEG
jgi:hypothetical protein